jgi:hypothetical protein
LRRLDKFLTLNIFNYYVLRIYLYKNEIPYETQRFYILNDKEDSIVYTSEENEELYKYFRSKPTFVTAIIENKNSETPSSYKKTKRRLFLSFVITFLTFLMIYKYYIIFIYQIIFLLPVILLWHILLTKFFPINNISDIKSRYKILVWFLLLLQAYICYKILIRPEIFFMKNEILWDLLITIKKTYTIEEKIMYIYQYFDKYTSNKSDLNIKQIEYMRHMLRQIDFSPIINESTTIEQIRNYIQTLPQHYIVHENTEALNDEKVT